MSEKNHDFGKGRKDRKKKDQKRTKIYSSYNGRPLTWPSTKTRKTKKMEKTKKTKKTKR